MFCVFLTGTELYIISAVVLSFFVSSSIVTLFLENFNEIALFMFTTYYDNKMKYLCSVLINVSRSKNTRRPCHDYKPQHHFNIMRHKQNVFLYMIIG